MFTQITLLPRPPIHPTIFLFESSRQAARSTSESQLRRLSWVSIVTLHFSCTQQGFKKRPAHQGQRLRYSLPHTCVLMQHWGNRDHSGPLQASNGSSKKALVKSGPGKYQINTSRVTLYSEKNPDFTATTHLFLTVLD